MANVFVDTGLTTGNDDGSTMDDAYKTIRQGFENSRSGGDFVWIRRRSYESFNSNVNPWDDGDWGDRIRYVGWPRAEEGAGTGTWTNGSTEVTNVSGLEMKTEQHVGRWVKQDSDGNYYLLTYIPNTTNTTIAFVPGSPDTITDSDNLFVKRGISAGDAIRITDSTNNDGTATIASVVAGTITLDSTNSLTTESAGAEVIIQVTDRFIIDRPYVGSSSGDFTIKADEYYTEAQAIDDSSWTIKKTDWNADDDDLPITDWSNGNHLTINKHSMEVFNMEFKNSYDYASFIKLYQEIDNHFQNLLLRTVNNARIIGGDNQSGYTTFENIIIDCHSRGLTTNEGIRPYHPFTMKNSAIYGCKYGIYNFSNGIHKLENVNIGVEVENTSYDLYVTGKNDVIVCKDLCLGGNNGYVYQGAEEGMTFGIEVENYQKTLNNNKVWYNGGTINQVEAGSGTPAPNQRSGGATYLIGITPNNNLVCSNGQGYIVFEHEYIVSTSQRTWRYYIQNDSCGTLTASDLWIEVEYVCCHDGTSNYLCETIASDESITERSDLDDWDQYIEVPNIIPALEDSKVKITCRLSKYDTDGHIYIDPKVSHP